MVRLLKHGILVLLLLLYVGHGMSACQYVSLLPIARQEASGGERAYWELANMPGEMVMGSGVHASPHVEPSFRYYSRDARSMPGVEHERAFSPHYHHVMSRYLHAFALRQDAGYYVFSLREIIV